MCNDGRPTPVCIRPLMLGRKVSCVCACVYVCLCSSQVLVALRENVEGRGRGNPLNPMMPWVNKLKPQPQLVRDIISAIDDEGNIMVRVTHTHTRAAVCIVYR